MPQPRCLTDEQEAAALALNRAGLSTAELSRTYHLTWQGMRDCLDRAAARVAGATKVQASRGTLDVGGPHD